MPDQQFQQLQTEDWILFLSTVLGSGAMATSGNSSFMLYGLTLGAASKALVSLGTNWRSLEDWILFGATFFGALGASLSNDSHYAIIGLILGMIGKALPSITKHLNSVEDWLLLAIMLGTTIIWVVAASPGTAMIGLFFGSLAKSLTSIDLESGNQQQISAPPGVGPPSGLSGNRNYILWNNCNPLVNPSVVFRADEDVRASGNWDLQVNVYAPSGTDAYMQFVLAVTTSGEVQWSIENWPISGNNLFNTCDQHLFQLPSSFLPKGYSISLRMNTDPVSNAVRSVDFGVSDSNGNQAALKHVPLDSTLPICSGKWDDSYLSQAIGFEPNVVGYANGVAVRFSLVSGGRLECSANAISASTSIPSCAEAKAGTVENSNMGYSAAVQVSQSLVTIDAQAF